jgi:signal transduction histidine kinase
MLRRVTAITDAGRDIMRGNLARRIALRGSGDEFDRLSANLNEMLDRIQMLMDGLRQVSNDIAHDLRTPLARLRQHLERARDRSGTVCDYEVAVDKAIEETDAILATFGALLRIAQIEAGTRRAAFTDVDLSGVLLTIVETFRDGPIKIVRNRERPCDVGKDEAWRDDYEELFPDDEHLRWVDLDTHPDEPEDGWSSYFDDPRAYGALQAFRRAHAAQLQERRTPPLVQESAELLAALRGLGYVGEEARLGAIASDELVLPPPGERMLEIGKDR